MLIALHSQTATVPFYDLAAIAEACTIALRDLAKRLCPEAPPKVSVCPIFKLDGWHRKVADALILITDATPSAWEMEDGVLTTRLGLGDALRKKDAKLFEAGKAGLCLSTTIHRVLHALTLDPERSPWATVLEDVAEGLHVIEEEAPQARSVVTVRNRLILSKVALHIEPKVRLPAPAASVELPELALAELGELAELAEADAGYAPMKRESESEKSEEGSGSGSGSGSGGGSDSGSGAPSAPESAEDLAYLATLGAEAGENEVGATPEP